MVKHTQTIGREQPTNCLSVLDHFVGLALKDLIVEYKDFGWFTKQEFICYAYVMFSTEILEDFFYNLI